MVNIIVSCEQETVESGEYIAENAARKQEARTEEVEKIRENSYMIMSPFQLGSISKFKCILTRSQFLQKLSDNRTIQLAVH